jgi:hypothetical protein
LDFRAWGSQVHLDFCLDWFLEVCSWTPSDGDQHSILPELLLLYHSSFAFGCCQEIIDQDPHARY